MKKARKVLHRVSQGVKRSGVFMARNPGAAVRLFRMKYGISDLVTDYETGGWKGVSVSVVGS